MLKFRFISISALFALQVSAQNTAGQGMPHSVQRPKLVIGVVVDQMRWDYLYRYYDRYAENGGFKRLINGGFSCENTLIPYAPSVTACGHSSIYTGAVPAVSGITGNDWYDYSLGKITYCTGDDNVKSVGSTDDAGQMSPQNLLVTTIGDELRLATNFRSKVIGIALKDRAAILPAGHSANAAYWYDDATGNWISSSYYINELPKWVTDLNAKKLVDQYFSLDWNTLYPLDTYVQSAPDVEPYEYRPFGRDVTGFPYNLKQFAGKKYDLLPVTPYGNTLTFDMAKAAIDGEGLGTGSVTDMLTLSLSTPDYIGHTFGPNSVEAEDDFLRLDKDLGSFLDYLDQKIGKNQYLIFFTADHGSEHVPYFLKQHKIPSGNANDEKFKTELDALLKQRFGHSNLLEGIINYQVFTNRSLIKSLGLNKDSVNNVIIDYLVEQTAVYRAFPLDALYTVTLNDVIKSKVANGYYPPRSGDIQILYKPQWIEGFLNGGTTHGTWNPYDAHIPLLWYGWNIHAGQSIKAVSMTDIAPTVTSLLHIQMPSGATGRPIEDVSR